MPLPSDYNRGLKNVYNLLAPTTSDEMRDAARLNLENARTGTTNPLTPVHELVQYLIALRA